MPHPRSVAVEAVISASKGLRPYRPSLVARLFMALRWIVRWFDARHQASE